MQKKMKKTRRSYREEMERIETEREYNTMMKENPPDIYKRQFTFMSIELIRNSSIFIKKR